MEQGIKLDELRKVQDQYRNSQIKYKEKLKVKDQSMFEKDD